MTSREVCVRPSACYRPTDALVALPALLGRRQPLPLAIAAFSMGDSPAYGL